MLAETRKKLVAEAQNTWKRIALDYLTICEDGSCTAEEAREAAADYVNSKDFFALSRQDKDSILEEAIPYDQTI